MDVRTDQVKFPVISLILVTFYVHRNIYYPTGGEDHLKFMKNRSSENLVSRLYLRKINQADYAMNSSPESRRIGNDKAGRDGGESNEDIDTLRKEYHNMQANRNSFAHECDLVRHGTHLQTP
jgi:hypothetical protein